MHLSTTLLPAAILAATSVEAALGALSIPSIIKAGSYFNVTGPYINQAPHYTLMSVGITSLSGASAVPGSIGSVIVSHTDLNKAHGGLTHKFNVPSGNLPASVQEGPAVVQAAFLTFSGALNTPAVETRYWAVTVGNITSTSPVFATSFDPNTRISTALVPPS